RAVASRAVPSEPIDRARDPVEHAVSGHPAPGDELLRGAGQLAGPGATAGDCLDRAAGADAGIVPRLHGRLLGADADLACRRAAGIDIAQGQARRSGPYGALSGALR